MKALLRSLAARRTLRFGVVGVVNALISFGILNLAFYKFGVHKIPASIIATTCALIFSFAMNRNFVFVDKHKPAHKQVLPFVIVTISGSLVVLNLVYIGFLHVLSGHEHPLALLIRDISGISVSTSFVDINLSTVVGAVVAMVWNYNGYKLFVFKGAQKVLYAQEPEA